MSETQPPVRRARLTEAEGCALLRVRFQEAGYAIQEHAPFEEGGVRVELDGFDPAARVGYEYLTTEAGDREEFTPEVVGALEARMRAGELFLLLVDEQDVDARGLSLAAERFLQVVARMRGNA
ncbi:MAG: hypothetical protein AB7N76_29805 [Planctomycetota bacterium]